MTTDKDSQRSTLDILRREKGKYGEAMWVPMRILGLCKTRWWQQTRTRSPAPYLLRKTERNVYWKCRKVRRLHGQLFHLCVQQSSTSMAIASDIDKDRNLDFSVISRMSWKNNLLQQVLCTEHSPQVYLLISCWDMLNYFWGHSRKDHSYGSWLRNESRYNIQIYSAHTKQCGAGWRWMNAIIQYWREKWYHCGKTMQNGDRLLHLCAMASSSSKAPFLSEGRLPLRFPPKKPQLVQYSGCKNCKMVRASSVIRYCTSRK